MGQFQMLTEASLGTIHQCSYSCLFVMQKGCNSNFINEQKQLRNPYWGFLWQGKYFYYITKKSTSLSEHMRGATKLQISCDVLWGRYEPAKFKVSWVWVPLHQNLVSVWVLLGLRIAVQMSKNFPQGLIGMQKRRETGNGAGRMYQEWGKKQSEQERLKKTRGSCCQDLDSEETFSVWASQCQLPKTMWNKKIISLLAKSHVWTLYICIMHVAGI